MTEAHGWVSLAGMSRYRLRTKLSAVRHLVTITAAGFAWK